ncbi:MAG TPA: DNA repair protein RadA [Gammaproteobacteria bacterium]|nr:DNA repair protein RadA [Gammaproteobacteria bacterium]
MAKPRSVFVCDACGAQSLKWQGQCDACGAWNSLVESRAIAAVRALATPAVSMQRLADVGEHVEARRSTGIGELDRVLGGGLVAGSATLIGGDPGIGKSTLLLQAAARMSGDSTTLYVTGEESLRQVGLRARRLGLAAANLGLLAQTCVEELLVEAGRVKPHTLVVDSVQTLYSSALQSAPGSVAQLRETAAQLVRFAKQSGTAVFLIGHVTKEGAIAGPRVLEHMVDTVLYFESDSGSRLRIVRAVKNRFGAANEIGVFAMAGDGLKEVPNPSAMFLSRHPAPVSGSAVMVTREGTRPLLVEVQALVDTGQLANPRRIALGLDGNRLNLLLAVLHRHAGVALAGQDVFVNVVGGVRVAETAADLPALLACVSSLRDRPLAAGTVAFGEVGLAGEIRPVPFGEERLRESAKHGFRRAIVPAANARRRIVRELAALELEVIGATRLPDAITRAFA